MEPPDPTVLIVDDERPITAAYASYLAADYDVRVAHDGEEALEQLDQAVDVVLLDRRMPNLSGDEVLSHITSEGYNCQVAMVTGVTPDFDIIEMGFDDYVTKPVSESELRATVEGLLQRGQYGEKLQELYATAKKHAAIQSEKSASQIEGSEEFDQLRQRLDTLRDEVDDAMGDLEDREGFEVAIDRWSSTS